MTSKLFMYYSLKNGDYIFVAATSKEEANKKLISSNIDLNTVEYRTYSDGIVYSKLNNSIHQI